MQALRRLLVAWKVRSPNTQPGDLVVSTADGGAVQERNLRRAIDDAKAAAGLAGLAGGLSATSNITVTGDSFLPAQSVALLVFAVVGGITTPAGAIVAGFIAQAGTPIINLILPNAGSYNLILFGIMAMDTTLRYPAGLGGMLPSRLPGLDALTRAFHRDRGAPAASGAS
jgi:hypothetical protein